MRVLIVEDSSEIRQNLARFLRSKGYSVDAVSDGSMGLHRAVDYLVDIAVIDCGLPGLASLDLIKRIRELRLEYPILVMTTYDRWEERTAFLEAGADDYIEKAFHPEAMLKKIEALLRKSGLMNEVPKSEVGKLKSDKQATAVSGLAVEN